MVFIHMAVFPPIMAVGDNDITAITYRNGP